MRVRVRVCVRVRVRVRVQALRVALTTLQQQHAALKLSAREQRSLWEQEITSIGELQVGSPRCLSLGQVI